MFLERCLRLLKSGGRLGIVLPNGNLNALSQAWLRRCAEGKAFLRAVVALSAATFRFSGASVTASVIFMQKFTDEDAKRWGQCWGDALTESEIEYGPRRATLLKGASEDGVHSGDDELRRLLDVLGRLGANRVLPAPTRTVKKGLVRGAPITTVRGRSWQGTASAEARDLKRKYAERVAQVPAT